MLPRAGEPPFARRLTAGHMGHPRTGLHRIRHDPGLLLGGPAPAPPGTGQNLNTPEATLRVVINAEHNDGLKPTASSHTSMVSQNGPRGPRGITYASSTSDMARSLNPPTTSRNAWMTPQQQSRAPSCCCARSLIRVNAARILVLPHFPCWSSLYLRTGSGRDLDSRPWCSARALFFAVLRSRLAPGDPRVAES